MVKGNLNIVVLDDHPMILTGLRDLLKRNPLIKSTVTFENPEDFRTHVNSNRVDIAIIDIRIFKSDAGLDMAKHIISKKPKTKVLIYSGNSNISYITECIKIGVKGFISKDSPIREIGVALEKINSGGDYFSKDVAELIANHELNFEPLTTQELKENLLTTRELEILKLVCKGYPDKEIANMLAISVYTVRTHRNRVLVKTQTKNARGLYQYALKNRIIYDKID
jgi:DNA-binding NarL/FixJ family response regulator